MKLGELARSLDTTTASVKFYIREGLLPPGRKVNQTTAIYDESHHRRLALILGLRGAIGTSLARIADLVAIIDDPEAGQLDVLEAAQTIGVEGRGEEGSRSVPGARTGSGDADAGAADASAAVARIIDEQDWPDVPSRARAAVERRLARVRTHGVDLDPQTLSRIAAAVASIGVMGLEVSGTRDEAALGVAVGTYEVSQLVVDMLSLAQTSHSVSALEP